MNRLSALFKNILITNYHKTAIQVEKKKYTYKTLDNISEKFLKFYNSETSFKNKIILIEGNKDFYTYCAILGAIKSNFTYSILDPKIKTSRLTSICKNKNNFLIVKTNKNFGYAIKSKNVEKVEIKKILKSKLDYLNKKIKDKKNTYIIFTSGSTGTPKGCYIGEQSILSFINIWTKVLNLHKKKLNFTQLNPLYFDNSVFDFYISIFSGSTLTVLDTSDIKKIALIPQKVNKFKCDVWFSVPSLLIYLLNLRLIKKKHFKKLKYIIFGGEGFPKNILKKLWKIKNKTLINVYGPSECTCICSYKKIKKKDIFSNKEKLVGLGKITDNFSYIVDSKKNIGELILYGKGVGNGYFNNKKETNKFFIKKQKKIIGYRTGDIVKKKNKELYFLGRKDNQVKIMGHRIELEEIEKNINDIKNVKESIVAISDNGISNYLTAHIYSQIILNEKQILKKMKKNLPLYMIPKKIFIYKKPLVKNRNFKIDRNFYKNK